MLKVVFPHRSAKHLIPVENHQYASVLLEMCICGSLLAFPMSESGKYFERCIFETFQLIDYFCFNFETNVMFLLLFFY